jgi:hypothetical protein
MYQPIAEMSFILIVGSLLLILTGMNAIATFQSKRRAKALAPSNARQTKPQAKIIMLPVNKSNSLRHKVAAKAVEEEVV